MVRRTAVGAAAPPAATAHRAPAPTHRPARPAAKPKPAPAVLGALPPAPPLTGCPPPTPRPGPGAPRPQGPPTVRDDALPPAVPVHGKAHDLAAVRGKGLWVTPFGTSPVDVAGVVRAARASGVRSLWIRTGGSRQGYYGNAFLPRLVPAAHRAGLVVVAWDFPALSDPVGDAGRARQALAAGVDAFSPDVETAAEGSYPSPRRVALYLSLVRRDAGARPVVATVPRPTRRLLRTFPYRTFVPYADAFAPMVYWSCNEPGQLVQESVARLGRLLPVAPVGQGYDMASDGGRAGTPSRAETLRFLDAARRAGAIGASLWTLEHAGRPQLQALAAYDWPAP